MLKDAGFSRALLKRTIGDQRRCAYKMLKCVLPDGAEVHADVPLQCAIGAQIPEWAGDNLSDRNQHSYSAANSQADSCAVDGANDITELDTDKETDLQPHSHPVDGSALS